MSEERGNLTCIGIVGIGSRGMSFGLLANEREDVAVTALCDTNPVRMRLQSEKLKGEQSFYTSIEEMLEKERLDAVIVTSPDFCHEPHAIACLEGGVDVFVDKPLATTVAGSRNIIAAAKKSQRTVMIGFNLRHDPTLRRLKRIVEEGVLGRVFLIENREFYDGGRTYMARWNRKREFSGGLWIHKGSHDFDVFNWLLGFPRPSKVSATAGVNVFRPEHVPFEQDEGEVGPTCRECRYKERCPDRYDAGETPPWGEEARKVDGYAKDLCIYTSDKDVHDNGIAIVEYENGARASHFECFVCSFSDRMYTVVGDRGVAEASLHNRSIVVRPRWSGETVTYKIPPATGGHGGSDPALFDAFLQVVRGKVPNTSTAEHGLLSTAVGQAAEISAREGRMVMMRELLG